MAVLKSKPTSPGRRHVVRVVNEDLHKGAPYAPLLEKQSRKGGRNNTGRIMVRHQGGGHKRRYRIIDFKRNKFGIPAKVASGGTKRSGSSPRPPTKRSSSSASSPAV